MSETTLGIIGGGQLGSMLAIAAKKLNIKTIIYCDDPDAPAQNFCTRFISAAYNNKEKIIEFVNLVDFVTYEFENIPFETLNEINKLKPVLPKPSVIRLIQHRIAEKDFVNNLNIRTTRYASVEKMSEIDSLKDLLPAILTAASREQRWPIANKAIELITIDQLRVDQMADFSLAASKLWLYQGDFKRIDDWLNHPALIRATPRMTILDQLGLASLQAEILFVFMKNACHYLDLFFQFVTRYV